MSEMHDRAWSLYPYSISSHLELAPKKGELFSFDLLMKEPFPRGGDCVDEIENNQHGSRDVSIPRCPFPDRSFINP
jgi:hypothetical protein